MSSSADPSRLEQLHAELDRAAATMQRVRNEIEREMQQPDTTTTRRPALKLIKGGLGAAVAAFGLVAGLVAFMRAHRSGVAISTLAATVGTAATAVVLAPITGPSESDDRLAPPPTPPVVYSQSTNNLPSGGNTSTSAPTASAALSSSSAPPARSSRQQADASTPPTTSAATTTAQTNAPSRTPPTGRDDNVGAAPGAGDDGTQGGGPGLSDGGSPDSRGDNPGKGGETPDGNDGEAPDDRDDKQAGAGCVGLPPKSPLLDVGGCLGLVGAILT